MSDFPISNTRTRVRPTLMAFAAAIVLVLAWTIAFAIQHRIGGEIMSASLGVHMTRALGVGLAASVGGALLIWAVLFFAIVRPIAPKRGVVHLAVLVAIAALVSVPIAAVKVLAAATNAEAAAIDRLNGVAQQRIAAHLDTVRAQRQEILSGGFMEPHAVAEAGGIARARRKLDAMRTLIRQSQAQVVVLRDKSRAEIAALPLSEGRRQAALGAFDQAYEQAVKDGQVEIDLADQVFAEMEGQLDVLSRTPRGWQPQYGMIGFSRQKDLDDFNNHGQRAQQLARQLDALERASARNP